MRLNAFPAAAAALALLCACGPSQKQIRRAVAAADHRTLAVLPFDYRGGARNAAPQAENALAQRLSADGFRLYDRGKTRAVYESSLDARTGAFDAVERDAELGRSLGVSAVVVGSCDDAYDRGRPAAFEFQLVPPPRCCYARNPCPSHPVYDPAVDHYVPSCEGWHRRVAVSPAQRTAGLTARVRFIDSGTGRVIWQTRYSGALRGVGLGQVVDQAMDVVNDQVVDALIKRRL